MITEKDLLEAIAECRGERNPTSATCIKLAAYYTILEHDRKLDRQEAVESYPPAYSYAPAPEPDTVSAYGDSDFLRAIRGKDSAAIWRILDDHMSGLQVVNERVYNSIMRRINAL